MTEIKPHKDRHAPGELGMSLSCRNFDTANRIKLAMVDMLKTISHMHRGICDRESHQSLGFWANYYYQWSSFILTESTSTPQLQCRAFASKKFYKLMKILRFIKSHYCHKHVRIGQRLGYNCHILNLIVICNKMKLETR